ncbi:PKD domain-containing protein [Parasediminibacterium sp. JCM 36343]|uniref:PKD domain-containing protein n=1 Tax=Parasediminibacterium sp. JCM 36343 TaxID=3374279 RepID=UPI00397A48E2
MSICNFSFSCRLQFIKVAVLSLAVVLFAGAAKAQQLATWTLNKTNTSNASGVAASVNAGVFSADPTFSGGYSATTGFKVKQSLIWPSSHPANNTFNLDFPLSPKAGSDLTITGISFQVPALSIPSGKTVSLLVTPYYQIDGAGSWQQIAPAQAVDSATLGTTISFGTLNQPFYNTHTYVVRMYVTSTTGATKNDNFNILNVIFAGTATVASSKPIVVTSTAVKSATAPKYAGTATGTYSITGSQLVNQSGVCWNTTGAPLSPVASLPTKTTDGSNGIINSTITGLSAATTYFVRAYAITQLDTIYGAELSFKTDPFTVPSVITNQPAANVLSNKATVGGTIVDSGGLPITNKVINYGTSMASLANTATPLVNTGSTPYTQVVRKLLPNTKYYYQACATNNQGTGCGNIDSFTTKGAVPTLATNTGSIDFGDIIYNINAPVLSYTLTGANLSPAADSITINLSPAAGFIVSSSASTFPAAPVSSFKIPYTGGKFTKVIYVKLLTNNYGTFVSAISHSGGGTAAQDADSVSLTANIIPSPDQLSNTGTDFWTGFAFQNNMESQPSDGAAAQMSIYIAAGNTDANVSIELPGISGAVGFPQTWMIPANTVKEIKNFPIGAIDQFNSGNAPDSRLYFTGISNRGVHIKSLNGVPVAVWMHTYTTNNSAGATMVFPTNTWGSAYSVQAYGGTTNSGNASSFFFVIAKDDNTQIEFTPSNDIVDSSAATIFKEANIPSNVKYAKGSTYAITLNKGQIFNAMAFVQGTGSGTAIGLDLSGTTVKTVDCSKKIAVFGGSGRVLVATKTNLVGQGSDNLVQQMFPKVAWGTKYLTVPTKTMEYNVFRINVQDANTKVWVNSPIHTAATALLASQYNSQGQYYPIEGNQPNIIESDKPISVTQFIIAGSAPDGKNKTTHPDIGNGGLGDPEMIILSPVQQAINSSTVYSSNFKNGGSGGSYINVVIKNEGVASFKLDNKQTADTGISSYSKIGVPGIYGSSSNTNIPMKNVFKVHPGDPSYSYAKFKVTTGFSHTLTSNVAFNAIAYGMDDGESYGYNAGTAINNLSSIKIAKNPFGNDTSSSVIKTCKDNFVTLAIALPYLPSKVDKIVWTVPNNSNINLSGSSNTGPMMTDPNNPAKQYADTSGTIVVDGQTFYIYTCPVQYKFSDYGFYPIVATAYGTFASECGGTDAQKIYVQVTGDNVDFTAVAAGCGSKNVTFTDNSTSIAGSTIVKWNWDFGDHTSESVTNAANPNPTVNPHVYPALSAYTAKLTTFSSLGCTSEFSVNFDLAFGIKAKFGMDMDTLCPGSTVTFSDSSSANAARRVWDFGEPTSGGANNASNLANPTHQYQTPGKHVITLQVFTSGGCKSLVYSDSVFVSPLPKPGFSFKGVCLPGSTTFTNTSDFATGFQPYSYVWDFGDNTPTTTTVDGVHTYLTSSSGGYTVKLVATNAFGCKDSITQTAANIFDKPKAAFTADLQTCFGDSTKFSDISTANKQTITKWNWDFGERASASNSSNLPSPKHKYGTINSFTVKFSISTDQGCMSDTATQVIKINPLPTPGFILPGSCLGSGTVTFTDKATIAPDDGTQQPFTYLWTFGDPKSGNNDTIRTATNVQHDYTAAGIGTYSVIQKVTTLHGCSAADTVPFQIAGSKPIPSFAMVNGSKLCSNVDVQLTDNSTIAIGKINTVQIIWDVVNNPSVIFTDNSPSNGAAGSSKTYTNKYPVSTTDKTYTVRLIAAAGSSCKDSITQTITVHGIPHVVFVSQVGICANATARLITGATETTGQAGNPGFTYSGSGVSGTSFNPATATVGANLVQALYTTGFGCQDSAKQPINVWPLPVPDFVYSSTTCVNGVISFTDKSTAGIGNIKALAWNFADAANATAANPNTATGSPVSHKYITAATYAVALTVTNDSGCVVTTPKNVVVNALPTADFKLPTNGICLPDGNGTFTDASTPAGLNCLWDFGDANNTATSASHIATHKFSAVADYQITLTVTVPGTGCSNTTTKTLPSTSIHPQPAEAYIVNPASLSVCLGEPITVTDKSPGTVKENHWNFGDNTTGTTPIATLNYKDSGSYPISHYIVDNFGCPSTTRVQTVVVHGLPVVNADLKQYILLGRSARLQATAKGSGLTYQWVPNISSAYLDDPALLKPLCTPLTDVTYTLTVTAAGGCKNTTQVDVVLLKQPLIPNAFSPNGDNINEKWNIPNLERFQFASVHIYNRYGQLVFQEDGYTVPWDGTSNGKPLPVGTYYYIIDPKNGVEKLSGSVTIIR